MKKVVLITGASAGMGKETVKLLLESGYIVYGAARRIEMMEDIRKQGAKILKMDMADEVSLEAGVDQIIKDEGRIDVLVNNAGFGSYGSVEDVPLSDAKYQLEINLFGLARLTQLVLPHMRGQRSGKIVNVTSIGGRIATPLGGWYHASKYAVEGLSDSLRLEVKQFGIDVILIEPGGIKTEWGGIATESMQKISGTTAYRQQVESAMKITKKANENNAEPIIIARLIKKAITVNKPKARYAAGYMAGMMLLMKKWLSDRMFDHIILSQFKS